MNTLAYPLYGGLYLNITNRCSNACTFCIRSSSKGVGYDLWLEEEPTAQDVIQAIGDPAQYKEIVFCGFGEPLERPEVLIEVARWLKSHPVSVRLNTNGLADLFLGYDILPRLQGLIDVISISLNGHDAQSYQEVCQSRFGLDAYPAVLDFIRRSKQYIPKVVASVVRYPGINISESNKIADKLGVEFRIREYQD